MHGKRVKSCINNARNKDIAAKWETWYNDHVKIVQYKGLAEKLATDILYKERLIKYYAKNGS